MTTKEPSLLEATLIFGGTVAAVVLGLRLKAGMQLAVILGVAVACIGTRALGVKWEDIQRAMFEGVADGLPAISILLLVGIIIGLWIAGGAIPTMIWYGLKWIKPAMLVPLACLLTAVASTATGTSFGTIATLGLALMGVGQASGVPTPLLAGAIISGSYFGDKMSPFSDTTNIAPAVSGTTLYEHISSMVYTTLPALLLSLVGFWFLGRKVVPGAGDIAAVDALRSSLEAAFNLGPFTLLPVLTLVILSVRRVPAIPALSVSILVSEATAFMTQGAGVMSLAATASSGFVGATGNKTLDSLLTRGGLTSMLPTTLLILGATAMGGVLRRSGVPARLVREVLRRVRSAGGLVISVIGACYLTLLASGNQMLAIILPGQAFKLAFPARGLHPKVLSRTLEDAGTLGAPLVPWSTASLFIMGVLKVPAASYAPYALLNWITPLIAGAYALTGMFLFKENECSSKEGDK